jgi:hypothetical protein
MAWRKVGDSWDNVENTLAQVDHVVSAADLEWQQTSQFQCVLASCHARGHWRPEAQTCYFDSAHTPAARPAGDQEMGTRISRNSHAALRIAALPFFVTSLSGEPLLEVTVCLAHAIFLKNATSSLCSQKRV